MAEGFLHCVLLLPQDELSAALNEIQHYSSLLKAFHVIFSSGLVEPEPVFYKMVDSVDGLVLSHTLFEPFPSLSEGFLLILLSLMLVIVEALHYFRVLLLHLHQKITQDTK
jgi:hypothetical protein